MRAARSVARHGWRVRELADAYGVAVTTVYGWIAAGLLPASQPARGVLLVMATDWERFLSRHRVGDLPVSVKPPEPQEGRRS